MSILNLDSYHMWPEAGYNKDTGISSYTNFGSCVGDIQSDLNAPKCYRSNDRWGSEYILEKLFSPLILDLDLQSRGNDLHL